MAKGAHVVVVGSILLLAAGCGSKESVSLSASIIDPSLTVEQLAIGTFLGGEFEMRLALGKFASDPVTIEAPSFALVDGDTRAELGGVNPLKVEVAQASFPLEVDPGQERTIAFTLDARDPVSTATDPFDLLCAAPVAVFGTVPHSLEGGSTTTARGPAVTPAGCP
jgi:hypothetical protein